MCLLEHLGTVLQCIKCFIWGPDRSFKISVKFGVFFFLFSIFLFKDRRLPVPRSYYEFCVILGPLFWMQ